MNDHLRRRMEREKASSKRAPVNMEDWVDRDEVIQEAMRRAQDGDSLYGQTRLENHLNENGFEIIRKRVVKKDPE